MRADALAACLALAFAAGAPEVSAQAPYPARAVRMLVPYPPGGGTDITARLVAQRLSEAWGQPVVVENRGGANGIIGTDLGAKAKPDGYTLIVVIASHAINAALYRNLPYDTATDFTPITLMARYPYIITATASLPVSFIVSASHVSVASGQRTAIVPSSTHSVSGPA